MSVLTRLRPFFEWFANTLAMSPTGCYAVGEFAAPWAELQVKQIAPPDQTQYLEEVLMPLSVPAAVEAPAPLRNSHFRLIDDTAMTPNWRR